jgi:ABC-type lipoprotein release transport system permease subunit
VVVLPFVLLLFPAKSKNRIPQYMKKAASVSFLVLTGAFVITAVYLYMSGTDEYTRDRLLSVLVSVYVYFGIVIPLPLLLGYLKNRKLYGEAEER